MNQNLFPIGQLSKISGITIKALRFYEKIGLIKPAYTDPATKYRYYSTDQFIHLDIIKAARDIQMSLKDVKAILDRKDNGVLLDYLERQKQSAQKKIAQLNKTVMMTEAVQSAIQRSMESVLNGDVYYKGIPERLIITKKLGETLDEATVLVEYSTFYKLIDDNGLINTYETGMLFAPDEKSAFRPSRLYNTVAADVNSNASLLSTLPAGEYACVCYHRQNALEQQAKLMEHLMQNNFSPRLLLQADLLNNVFAADNQFAELQVLV